MASVSKHKLDIEAWLYKVIYSCTTIQQALSAKRLCRLYEKRFPSKEFGDTQYITNKVLIEICDHQFSKVAKEQIKANK